METSNPSGFDGFPTRLQELIGDDSVSKFASEVGLGDNLIRKYLDGSNPGADKLIQIAKAKNVNLLWLATGEGQKDARLVDEGVPMSIGRLQNRLDRSTYAVLGVLAKRSGLSDLAINYLINEAYNLKLEYVQIESLLKDYLQQNPSELSLDDDTVAVPRFDVSASMGNGDEVFSEDSRGSLRFKRSFLQSRGIEVRNARLIDGHGDSMEPLLFDRDLILIDKGTAENWGDGIYCVRLDGRLMVKRLQRVPGGVKVISENSSKYEPLTLDLSDEHSQREFTVIGKMRWFARET